MVHRKSWAVATPVLVLPRGPLLYSICVVEPVKTEQSISAVSLPRTRSLSKTNFSSFLQHSSGRKKGDYPSSGREAHK